MKKRLFVFFLTAMVLFSSLPMSVLASGLSADYANEQYNAAEGTEEDMPGFEQEGNAGSDIITDAGDDSNEAVESEDSAGSEDAQDTEETVKPEDAEEAASSEDSEAVENQDESISSEEQETDIEDSQTEEYFDMDSMDQAAGDDINDVNNEVKGLSLVVEQCAGPGGFDPIPGKKDREYIVAAGIFYKIYAIASPAYTQTGNTSVHLDPKMYSLSDDGSNYISQSEVEDFYRFYVPEEKVAEGKKTVKVTGTLSGKEFSYSINLTVCKQPEQLSVPDTFIWTDVSDKLKDAPLIGDFRWKDPETTVNVINEIHEYSYPAVATGEDVYPYEKPVKVYFLDNPDPQPVLSSSGQNGGQVSDGFFAITEGSIEIIVKNRNNLPEEYSAYVRNVQINATGKNKDKIEVIPKEKDNTFVITPHKDGTYTFDYTYELFKPIWTGDKIDVKSLGTFQKKGFLKITAAQGNPIREFYLDDASEEMKALGFETLDDNIYEYKIDSDEAYRKLTEQKISFTMHAKDIFGYVTSMDNVNLRVSSSDSSIATAEQDKNDKSKLNVKLKKNDGCVTIKLASDDSNHCTKTLIFRIKNYAPQKVCTYKNPVMDKKCTGVITPLADFYIPYSNLMESEVTCSFVSRLPENSDDKPEAVPGIYPDISVGSDLGKDELFSVGAHIENSEEINAGTISCYAAVSYIRYKEVLYIPVKIKITDTLPKVKIKQESANNLFYTDTTKEKIDQYNYIAKEAGTVLITCSNVPGFSEISKVEWVPKEEGNKEFAIRKNTNYYGRYIIDNQNPKLDKNNKPSSSAVQGQIYVYFKGYGDENPVKVNFTIKTKYAKPVLKADTLNLCPKAGIEQHGTFVYSNAFSSKGEAIWKWREGNGSLGLTFTEEAQCSDPEVSIEHSSIYLMMTYSGTKDKKVTMTYSSKFWKEPLKVTVKIKVFEPKVKLKAPTVTLDLNYPTELTKTWARTCLIVPFGSGKFRAVNFDRMEVSATGTAKQLLDKGLINIYGMYLDSPGNTTVVMASLNYDKAMNQQLKSGTYKYTIQCSKGELVYNKTTLTVKVIGSKASVKVKVSGKLNLLKGISYSTGYSLGSGIKITPKFSGVDSSYSVKEIQLEGDYASYFLLGTKKEDDNSCTIVPAKIGQLKAGKTYKLQVVYTLDDSGDKVGSTNEYSNSGADIVLRGTITIKTIQKTPKVKVNPVTITNTDYGYVYSSLEHPEGYYCMRANGSIDVNGDGKADIVVNSSGYWSGGSGRVALKVSYNGKITGNHPDGLKASKSGVTYKVPVEMQFLGSDGTKSGTTTVYVPVKVKK